MRSIRSISKNQDKNNDDELTQDEINYLNEIELERISKSKMFENFYTYINNSVSFILRTTAFIIKVSGIYLLWICLHYFSAHLYIKFCVPNSIVGFIMSPFMIMTPHCQGLRWIVYNAANIINHMWILIGAWVYSMIWVIGNKQPHEV